MLLEQQRWAIIQREHPPTALLLLDATIDCRAPHDDDDDDDDDDEDDDNDDEDDCIDDDDQDVVSATTAASSATTAVVTSRSGRIDICTCAKTRVVVGDWGGGGWTLWRLSMIASWVCEARQGAPMNSPWFEFSEFSFCLFGWLWYLLLRRTRWGTDGGVRILRKKPFCQNRGAGWSRGQ